MAEYEKLAAAVVAQADDKKLVSRIRFQKVIYLLQQMGLNSELEFNYHHFGPYSRDLDLAILDAKSLGLLEENIGRRQSDGATYSIFVSSHVVEDDVFSGIGSNKARELIREFSKENVTVLELAATAHWLRKFEHIADWKSELRRRKGSKTDHGRLEKAIELLGRHALLAEPISSGAAAS